MNYTTSLSRETDLNQLSIAACELSCILSLIKNNFTPVDNHADFYTFLEYANQLQKALLNMELELKKQLREINDSK